MCSFQDITARRTHEAAIRASEARAQEREEFFELALDLRAQEREEFFELGLDLLCVADLDRGFLKLSRSFESILGWSPEEMLGRPFLELVHPEDRVASEDALRQLLEGRTTAGFESRYRCKDGSWKWLAWRAPPPAPGSRILHAVARDVSTQRRGADSPLRLAGPLSSADAA